MVRSSGRRFLFVTALAALSLRALTPDGYMPGSAGSGLLYELCPDGMPSAVMAALYGDKGHGHHKHTIHGDAGDDVPAVGTEQCPIGHMLASAVAVDVEMPVVVAPDPAVGPTTSASVTRSRSTLNYRSRAPPA